MYLCIIIIDVTVGFVLHRKHRLIHLVLFHLVHLFAVAAPPRLVQTFEQTAVVCAQADTATLAVLLLSGNLMRPAQGFPRAMLLKRFLVWHRRRTLDRQAHLCRRLRKEQTWLQTIHGTLTYKVGAMLVCAVLHLLFI